MEADEPGFTSTRTDADTHVDDQMRRLASWIGPIGERRRGYVRDELLDAFHEGAHQELCRALLILGIAQRKTTDDATRAALLEVSYLLAPDLRENVS